MPNFIGGDMEEAVCSHPTLGDFRYQAKSGEAATVDKGGIRNADDNSMVTGGGIPIQQKNRKGWSVEVPLAVDMTSGNELDGLDALAASPDPGVWTFSFISGAIYKGTGWPLGDLNFDSNTAQMKLKVGGGGQLEMIS